MKYFLHDTNSFNDEKITELFIKFGYEGLGLFYTILEKIAAQEKPIKTSVLKSQLRVGKRLEKCWQFMESLGVINKSNDETFNIRILSYSEKYQIKKEKNAKRISEWREKQVVIENVTHYESVCNAPKVKLSKEKVYNNKKEIFINMPLPEHFNGLPEMKIGASIELVRITKQANIDKKNVQDLWEVFKIQNLTGKKYYQDQDSVYSHFINWIKKQDFKGTDFSKLSEYEKDLNEKREKYKGKKE